MKNPEEELQERRRKFIEAAMIRCAPRFVYQPTDTTFFEAPDDVYASCCRLWDAFARKELQSIDE